jgi:hypothetical protein
MLEKPIITLRPQLSGGAAVLRFQKSCELQAEINAVKEQ